MSVIERFSLDIPATIKTSDYTLLADDSGTEVQFDSATSLTASLPAVVDAGNGYNILIRNIGTASLTISSNGTEMIDGSASDISLGSDEFRWIRSDGTEWKSITQEATGTMSSVCTSGGLEADGVAGGCITTSGTVAITDSGVTTAKIANLNVTNAKLATDAVTSDKILDGTIATADIADLAITNAKLAADSVTADKIQAGAVNTSEIATGAVTSNEIAADAVTASEIAANAVGSSEISDGSVTLEKLENDAKGYDFSFVAGFDDTMTLEDVAVQSYGEVVIARALTIEGEIGYIDTVATGSAVDVDILKNGTSVYSSKPSFAASANSLTAGTLSTTSLISGDRLTFKVTQIGSTIAGQGLRVTLKTRLA